MQIIENKHKYNRRKKQYGRRVGRNRRGKENNKHAEIILDAVKRLRLLNGTYYVSDNEFDNIKSM